MDTLREAAADAGVSAVITWGVDDGQSWLPDYGGGEDPLLFDREFEPRPAHGAVVEALSE